MKKIIHLLKPSYLKISLGISILFVIAYLISPSFFELLELKTIDARFQKRPPVPPGKEVVIATIDEKSLDELGRWPWPRTMIAQLIDSLQAYGVKVIAFDIVFSEPDQHSALKALLTFKEKYRGQGSIPQGFTDYINTFRTELDSDAVLGKSIAKSRRVVLGYFFHFAEEGSLQKGKEIPSSYDDVQVIREGVETILNASAVESNIEAIAKGAKGVGYYNIIADPDGSVRWGPLVIGFQAKYHAPLSLAALKAYLENPPLALTLTDYGVAHIKLGSLSIPVDESGRLLINYYGGQKTFPHYSIADIINNRIEKEKLKDKIVLVGSTAIGIYDMRVTPFAGTYPGVEIHATIIDNILSQRFMIRPQWFSMLDIFIMVCIGIFLGILVPRLNALSGVVLIGSFLAGYVYFSAYLFNNKGIVVNITYPVLMVAVTYSSLILYRWTLEAMEKKKLKNTFQFYVAAPVMEELLRHPEKLKLGGEEKELTVLFSDIRRFTTLGEGLKPNTLITLLNDYLSAMSNVVFKYEGYLDKYIGDAIMAVYGAPLMQEDHTRKACLTALEMIEELDKVRRTWEKQGFPSLNIGIGINTGTMVVGNIGSQHKYDYTVIGDNVNLASRLEGLNKLYETNIIISSRVYEIMKEELLCRELDIVQVKGRAKAVTIYELLGKKETVPANEFVESFHQGIRCYREKRWNEAIHAFHKVLTLKPADSPSILYLNRCQQFIASPPPENWKGVFIIAH